MRTAVITFPGSNCDRDLAVAFKTIFGTEPLRVWYQETILPPVDLIGLPGGFSYGDYLRAGAISARAPIMAAVREQARKGVRVIGICNGFQILTEAGLLPGALIRNASLTFVCRVVKLTIATSRSPFTQGLRAGQSISLPVAHHDGNYVIDEAGLARLQDDDRIALRYEENPNGSMADIAGILNEERNVLGLMPHPERMIEPLHGGMDGRALLQSLAAVTV